MEKAFTFLAGYRSAEKPPKPGKMVAFRFQNKMLTKLFRGLTFNSLQAARTTQESSAV